MASVKQWFDALAPREKLLVLLATVLTIIAILVIGVLRPLAVNRSRLNEQVTDKQAVLADIERVAARLGQAGGRNTPPGSRAGGESLVVLIDRTTRSRGLGSYLRRNEPDGASSIRLRFENAPFDDLIAWVAEMQVSHGVGVTSASVEPAAGVGRVSASLQLTRAASG